MLVGEFNGSLRMQKRARFGVAAGPGFIRAQVVQCLIMLQKDLHSVFRLRQTIELLLVEFSVFPFAK